jgi:drug/metabolite transporter (DMT)-like permease
VVFSFLRALNGRSNRLAKTRLVTGAFIISFSGVWVKISHVTATASAFYRVLFGGIFLLLAALMNGEVRWLRPRHMMWAFFCGLLISVDLICYHSSINYIGPGLGTILPNFQVFILAVVGALFLKEKLSVVSVLSMPIAFAGLFMIVGIHWERLDPMYKLGIYFGLSAAVFYALFLLLLRRLQAEQTGRSIFQIIMLVSLTAAALLALELLRTGDSFRIPDGQSFWALAALGLFSQAVGWILITNALPYVRASLSGLILLLQPALSFVWDVLFFNRPTSLFNWIGVTIVLCAIYFGTTGRSRGRKPRAGKAISAAGRDGAQY